MVQRTMIAAGPLSFLGIFASLLWFQRLAAAELCYASHMAESPMELILEVRYAWH